MLDRLTHKVFHLLWRIWHIHLRRFFDRFAPPCSSCKMEIATMRELAAEGYQPAIRSLPHIKCYHAKYITTARPWWHLCCNGDPGGWRTTVCDFLEHKWRS